MFLPVPKQVTVWNSKLNSKRINIILLRNISSNKAEYLYARCSIWLCVIIIIKATYHIRYQAKMSVIDNIMILTFVLCQ